MYKFLGIGAQKAGTTWLYEMLRQHPDIAFPLNKEVHYWDNVYPHQAVDDYFAKFQHPTLYEGEITPAYAFLPPATIAEIHRYQPTLKIIYIIRNPIDRAWSSAKMALGRAEMEFYEASDQWFIDHFNSKGSLLRGDYQACLQNWYSVFNKNQLLVISFEEIAASPRGLLLKCCDFLEIKEYSAQQLDLMHASKPVFSSAEHPLNATLEKHLHYLYQEKIDSLEDYLNVNLSQWK